MLSHEDTFIHVTTDLSGMLVPEKEPRLPQREAFVLGPKLAGGHEMLCMCNSNLSGSAYSEHI